MVQVLPQVRVFQEFETLPTIIQRQQTAFIFGPHYNVRSYVKDKSQVSVGPLDYDTQTTYSYPNREAGEVVDSSYTRVRIDNAVINFFNQLAADGGNPLITASGATVSMSGTYGWAALGGFARYPGIVRDIKVNDLVELSDPAVPGTVFKSRVRNVLQAQVASTIGSSSADAGNQAVSATHANTVTSTPTVPPTDITFTANSATYDGTVDGIHTDSYTVTVVRSGLLGVAEVTITSASGFDDVYNAVVNDGVPILTGRGMSFEFEITAGTPSLTAGQTWVVDVTASIFAVPTLPVTSGTYVGSTNTTYIITITRGGVVNGNIDTGAIFTVSTSTGVDNGGPYAASNTPVSLGQYGVRVAFTSGQKLNAGDIYYVVATAVAKGRASILQTVDAIPTALVGVSDLNIKLSELRTMTLTKPRYNAPGIANWTDTATEVTINPDPTYYSGNESDVLNGSPVIGGDLYISYRALSQEYVNTIQTISNVGELSAYFTDLTPDNPLGFGVKKALENSNGSPVRFIGVKTNDVLGYTFAVNKTLEREDVYSFVPLSSDPAVLSLVVGHVNGQSSPEKGRWRVAWGSVSAISTLRVVGSTLTLATIADAPLETAGTNRLVTAQAGTTFVTSGVRAGDIVRYAYGVDAFGGEVYASATVDEVVSETQLLLLDGPDTAVSLASKVEVWRDLETGEQVSDLVVKNSYGERRLFLLPDAPNGFGPVADGYSDLPDMFLACGYAGLRSGSAPHQGLTNVQLAGFQRVPYFTDVLTGADLDALMNAGYWLTFQDPNTGDIYCRKQISTDLTDVKTSEQSVTTNVDSISYVFKDGLAPYIGRTNNVATVQTNIEADINSIIEFFLNNTNTPTLGGQLTAGSILEIRPHATQPDRLIVRIDIETPVPLNNADITLVI